MKKLIDGIVEFRKERRDNYLELYSQLAAGQSPDTLFVACSDSRVVPNTFASTNPGDLFVLRNVGNLIAPCGKHGHSISDEGEAAAIEFAILTLNVSHIVICGHSECGAMRAIYAGRSSLTQPNFKSWLRHGEKAMSRLRKGVTLNPELSPHNQLSQLNVLLQIEHVLSYPEVSHRIADGKLSVHGWWFDLAKADVYNYDTDQNQFVLIDENSADQLIKSLNH